jgi:hypothetical protein
MRRAIACSAALLAWAGSARPASSGRNLAQVVTDADVERSSSASRTGAGAVTSSALSWLMAAVRALLAPRRAVRNTRIASTIPSRRLGAAVAVPASTARAA